MQIHVIQSPQTGDDVPVDTDGYVDEVTLSSSTPSVTRESSTNSLNAHLELRRPDAHLSTINNTETVHNPNCQTAENSFNSSSSRTHVYRSSSRVLQHRCSFGNCCRDTRSSTRHTRSSTSAAAHRNSGTMPTLPTSLNIPFETATATTTTTSATTLDSYDNGDTSSSSSFSCRVPTGLQQQQQQQGPWSSQRIPPHNSYSSSDSFSSSSNSSTSNSYPSSDNSNSRLQSSCSSSSSSSSNNNNNNSDVSDTRGETLSRGIHAPRLLSSVDPHQHLLLLQQQQQQQLQLQQQQMQLQALRVHPHYRKRAINYMMAHLQLRSNENDKNLEAVRKGIERLEGQVFNTANSKDQYVDLLAIKLGAIMERLYNCRTSRVSRPQFAPSHHLPQSACV